MGGFVDFFTRTLPPHGYCLLWWPQLLWTHVAADALIALAYFSIPLAIIHFIRRRKDMQFGMIFWLFAVFITACGATHVMSIWTLWNGDYGAEALVKVVTAIASVLTAIILWPLIPRALAIPSSSQLQRANEALAARVAERDDALAALRHEAAERRKAEAALFQAQKIEAVGQLTGGIAHDFNNLLQAVSGNIELIGKHAQDHERLSRWAANAAAALERGKKLTGQLLAFSRTQELELRPVGLRHGIAETVEILNRTLDPAITIEPDLGAGDWYVLADPTQLEIAILNLAINARDAMPAGGTLRITTRPVLVSGDENDLPNGQYIDIAITDTGTGMPASVADRAFEPFFTTKNMGKATGLGLSMVFGVARQSGGTVLLESEEGRGTTVTIRLRQVAAGEMQAFGAKDARPDDGLQSDGERLDGVAILLVDDDDEVRTALTDALQYLGASVTSADGGARAIALLRQSRPDIVVLDYAMPGMTGAEAAARIGQIRPDLPIIIASGYSDSAALRTAMGDRIILLRKPFLQAELAGAIHRALLRRRE
jgi:signal transduction histidine kinase